MGFELRAWTPGELEKIVVKTEGYWVEYKDGKRILDMQSGNSAYILGYGNEEVIEAMNEQIRSVAFVRGNRGETAEICQEMAQLVCETGGFDVMSWAVTGSSAVEAAIAMNDTYWKRQKIERPYIISFTPGYHGTTHLTKAMGLPHLQEFGLERVLTCEAPRWMEEKDRAVEEDKSLKHLERLVERHKDKIGCIVMESCPWYQGILPWSENWWKTIRAICDKNDILMITDDVAVCWGKALHYHGYQVHGIQPDISALGKSLSAGYTPLGAAVGNAKVGAVLRKNEWEFGHTWQPNMMGIAAMKAVNNIIVREKLFEKAVGFSEKFKAIAESLKAQGYIKSYRHQGLFLAIDTDAYTTINNLVNAGLGATTAQMGTIKIIGNLVADDEYFAEMEKRLTVFFERQ